MKAVMSETQMVAASENVQGNGNASEGCKNVFGEVEDVYDKNFYGVGDGV